MNEKKTSDPSANDPHLPGVGRIAGIDFGTVRIGVSITDPNQILASPHDNYDRSSPAQDLVYFQNLASQEGIVGWVVGLPIHTDGNESQKSGEAREFGRWLSGGTGLPVAFFDERYTSSFANEILKSGNLSRKKKKKRLDMIASQIMLSAFLESSRNSSSHDLAD